MTRKFLLISAFLLCVFANANSQTSATISGVVKDSIGKPMVDVLVTFLQSNTLTNENGFYAIDVSANSTIQISFSYSGRNSKTITVTPLQPNQKFVLDVKMDFGILLLKTTVIKDERFRSDISTVTIDPLAVKTLPNASGSFEGILKTFSGVSSNNEMSSQYNVRGGNFDENLVYVNDIEIYRPFIPRSGQQEGLSFIHTEMVQNAKFSAGGFEAKYGDKLSSVLDVKYRDPKKFGATASMSLLGAQTHIEGASKNARFTYLFGARYWTNKYLASTLDIKGDYQPSFTDVQTLITCHITSQLSLSVLASYAQNRYFFVPTDRTTTFGTVKQALQLNVYFDGADLMEYRTATGAASIVYKPNKNTQLKFISSVFYSNENEFYTIEGAYRLSELETDLGSDNFARARALRGIGYFINDARNVIEANVINVGHRGICSKGKHNLQWGAFVQTEQIFDKLKQWNYSDSAGFAQPTLVNGNIELPDYLRTQLNFNTFRINGYIQNSQVLNSVYNLTVNYGIRSNWWSYTEENVISPRVQISFEPNRNHNRKIVNDSSYKNKKPRKDWVIKAAYGYYYQPPFYRELRNFNGILNPNIQSQRAIHYVISGDMNFKAWNRPFKFVTEAYFKQLDFLIPYEIDNVRIRYFADNTSTGYATGIDFRINGEFVKGIESWASLSILEAKEIIEKQVDAQGNAITPKYIPRPTNQLLMFAIMFQDYLPNNPAYKINLNLVYGSGFPFGPPDHNKYNDIFNMPSYRRVDIGFSKDLIDENEKERNSFFKKTIQTASLSLEVFNILGVDNTVSYTWVFDATGQRWAVPNYLTSRRLNLKLLLKF